MAILGDNATPSPGLERSIVRLHHVLRYCRQRHRCKRAHLLEYLGEDSCDPGSLVGSQPLSTPGTPGFCAYSPAADAVRCGRCDVCCAGELPPRQNMASELMTLLQCASAKDKRGSGCSRSQ